MAPTKATDGRKKPLASGSLVLSFRFPREKLAASLRIDHFSRRPSSTELPQGSSDSSEPPAVVLAATPINVENGTESGLVTPIGVAILPSTVVGPSTEVIKKKGVKRTAAALSGPNNPSEPKVRKPPVKKKKTDDGVETGANVGKQSGSGQRLGPRANQGAINAGLRALDRGGKPCRKWIKGGFSVKTFTGAIWEIPRWTAPPKGLTGSTTEDSTAASTTSSTRESKENAPLEMIAENISHIYDTGGDVEMRSVPSFNASSPAPLAITAAS